MSADFSGDHVVFDGSETVSLAQAGQSPVQVMYALREQLSIRDMQFADDVGLQPTDVAFNLPAIEMAGRSPAAGDVLVDATGASWTVISETYDTLIEQFRVLCRRCRS